MADQNNQVLEDPKTCEEYVMRRFLQLEREAQQQNAALMDYQQVIYKLQAVLRIDKRDDNIVFVTDTEMINQDPDFKAFIRNFFAPYDNKNLSK